MNKVTLFVAALAIVGATKFASAQEGMGGMGGPPSFAAIDADKNGQLSLQEIAAMPNTTADQASQRLTAWDADKNGTVSETEFDSRPRGGMGMGGG